MYKGFILALVAMLSLQPVHAKPPSSWDFRNWDEAVAQSTAEKKPLFIMFGYEDCQWCEHLYRRGMNDSGLEARYKQSVVLTYVDTKSNMPDRELVMPGGERITHAELIKRFQAYPTPSWVFISPKGALLHGNRNGKSTTRELQLDVDKALAKL